MARAKPDNTEIAALLERIADLLEASDANPFKVRAYRQGANSVRAHETPVTEYVVSDEFEQLTAIPAIGRGLGAVIGQYVVDGRSDVLDDLEADVTPARLFMRIPGIGDELARRIVETLQISTLEDLEEAARDGRLGQVDGFGERRVQAVRASLAGMLQRGPMRRRFASRAQDDETRVSVATLLDVDAEYQRKAQADQLERITPRRFNPDNQAWLPILHTRRDGWKFHVLYSNTAQAHDLGKTHDWVVIYYDRADDDDRERQVTVVTETSGDLKGKRVVRGREAETRRFYEASSNA